jgi:geranylgeranyl diphosphate synthase type II
LQTQSPQGLDDLWGFVASVRPAIDEALEQSLSLVSTARDSELFLAVTYSLFPGGKRLRPALALLAAELVGGDWRSACIPAVVVEYIHTSSLILDDLPCMDNATVRRDRPCLHLVHGEAVAILAAISLLNASYGLIVKSADADAKLTMRAHRELVDCLGPSGMIAGQAIDLMVGARVNSGRGRNALVYNLKTSALLRLALRLGAITSGATNRQLAAMSQYSRRLGELYQMADDLQDSVEDGVAKALRSTEENKALASRLAIESEQLIVNEFGAGPPACILTQLADYCVRRIIESGVSPRSNVLEPQPSDHAHSPGAP